MRKGETEEYTYASISTEIRQTWGRKKQGSTLRVARPKAIRSAFPAKKVTLNGEEADAPEAAKATTKSAKKGKRKRNQTSESQNSFESQTPSSDQARPNKANKRENKREDRDPCWACGGRSHPFTRCFLAQGVEKDFLTQEARETFDNNMYDASNISSHTIQQNQPTIV